MTPRLKIISDGTRGGTHITLNGTPLTGVQSIRWEADVQTHLATVTLELLETEVDLEANYP